MDEFQKCFKVKSSPPERRWCFSQNGKQGVMGVHWAGEGEEAQCHHYLLTYWTQWSNDLDDPFLEWMIEPPFYNHQRWYCFNWTILLSIRQCLPLFQVIVKDWSSNTMFAMYRSHLFVYFSSWIKSLQIFLQQACNGYKGWSKTNVWQKLGYW